MIFFKYDNLARFWLGYGGVVSVIVWCLDLQLPMQLVPITTDVVSRIQGGVYNIMW